MRRLLQQYVINGKKRRIISTFDSCLCVLSWLVTSPARRPDVYYSCCVWQMWFCLCCSLWPVNFSASICHLWLQHTFWESQPSSQPLEEFHSVSRFDIFFEIFIPQAIFTFLERGRRSLPHIKNRKNSYLDSAKCICFHWASRNCIQFSDFILFSKNIYVGRSFVS